MNEATSSLTRAGSLNRSYLNIALRELNYSEPLTGRKAQGLRPAG